MVYNHKQFAEIDARDCYKVNIFVFGQEEFAEATKKETNGFLTQLIA